MADISQNEEADKLGQSSRTQITFRMPKLEVELFAMDQEYFQKHAEKLASDFCAHGSEAQRSIAYMQFSGLQIDFTHQTFPVNQLLTVELKSLSLKDP